MSTDKDKSRERTGAKATPKDKGVKTGLFGRLFGRRKEEPAPEDREKSRALELSQPADSSGTSDAEPRTETSENDRLVEEKAAATEPDVTIEKPGSEASTRQPDEQAPGPAAAAGKEPPAAPEAPGKEEQDAGSSAPGTVKALEPVKQAEKKGLFSRLKEGLAKTRNQFVGTLDNLLYGDKEIDEEFLEELEEILLTSDLGVKTSYRLFAEVEEKVSHKELENPAHLRRFLQQEIGAILKQAEGGVPVAELCREHGMSSASFYKWRSKYGGMDASMMARMKELEAENKRLKKMYADLSLQNDLIKEAMAKKW